MQKPLKCYYCDKPLSEEDMVIKPVPLVVKGGKIRNYKRKFHYDCLAVFMKENKDTAKKTEELSDWDKVYQYFRSNILGMPVDIKLPEFAVQRLQGLRVGKYIPNATNVLVTKQGHTYKAIYYAMQAVSPQCKKARQTVRWENTEHIVNYMIKIIEPQIAIVESNLSKLQQENKQAERFLAKQDMDKEVTINKPVKKTKQGFDWIDEDW